MPEKLNREKNGSLFRLDNPSGSADGSADNIQKKKLGMPLMSGGHRKTINLFTITTLIKINK